MSVVGGPDIVRDGLVYYYDFKNTDCYNGTDVSCYDLGDEKLIGTISGTTFQDGYFTFNNSINDVIDMPNPLYNPSGESEFTISTWATTETGAANRTIIWSNGGTSANGIAIQSGNPGLDQIMCYVGDDGSPFFVCTCTENNVWFNVAFVFNGALSTDAEKVKMYFNGQQKVLTISGAGFPSVVPTLASGSFQIGGNARFARYWDGNIGIIKWYNRALTAAEALQNYEALKGRYIS